MNVSGWEANNQCSSHPSRPRRRRLWGAPAPRRSAGYLGLPSRPRRRYSLLILPILRGCDPPGLMNQTPPHPPHTCAKCVYRAPRVKPRCTCGEASEVLTRCFWTCSICGGLSCYACAYGIRPESGPATCKHCAEGSPPPPKAFPQVEAAQATFPLRIEQLGAGVGGAPQRRPQEQEEALRRERHPFGPPPQSSPPSRSRSRSTRRPLPPQEIAYAAYVLSSQTTTEPVPSSSGLPGLG